MIKWNRNFFGRAQGTHSTAKADVECAQAQISLTAAFDGESDQAALAAAQHHLQNCANCARRWEEWEKTRILLRSVPAPAPPSPLLGQVLLSCRLLPTTELQSLESELAPVQSEELYSPLVAYLQATSDEHTDVPLARFIQSPAVPAHLHSQILEKTTRAQTPQRVALWPVVHEVFLGWSAPRAARWGAGLAVPALAAWLIFAGQTEYPVAPTATAPPRLAIAPRVSAKTGASTGAKINPLIARALTVAPKAAPVPKSPVVGPVTSNTSALQAVATHEPETIAVEASAPIRANSAPVASLTVSVKKHVAIVRHAVASSKKRGLPLVDMVENARPRLINASLQSKSGRPNLTRIRHSSGRSYQISDPENATAPRLAQLSDLDFEEAFIAVTSQRDDRPEDLGRVFDEYRASLIAEKFEDEDDLDDL